MFLSIRFLQDQSLGGSLAGTSAPSETIAGTYSINGDCTGSTSDDQGHSSFLVLVNNGKEVLSEGTDKGAVATITLKKQSSEDNGD